jgi:predicted amino acid racemase
MATPYVTIDLDKIEHNARTIVGLCKAHDIEVTGVTKGVCGHPDVAEAMLRGGVASIADSRMKNIQRLKAAGVRPPYMLLRIPPLSGADDVIKGVDVSLNSELSVLEGLSDAAQRRGRVHEVIVMVDLGDLREGIWPDELLPFIRQMLRFSGVHLAGLGTNLACFGGVIPSEQNMNQLVECAREVEERFGLELRWLSGVNSSGLELIASGRMPKRINHARIGEAILLGRETVHRRHWPDTFQDAFALHAEVLELKCKPSVPIGEQGEDAFAERPSFEDRGEVDRALLNVGREDIDIAGITPCEPRFGTLGASSGYLIMDVTQAAGGLRVGDEVSFFLNYSALLAVMTSDYVEKRPLRMGISLDSASGQPE